MSQLLHQHHTGGSLVWSVLETLADNWQKQLLLLCSERHNIMLTMLELIQCNKLVPSVLIGRTRIGPLVGQSGDDDVPKRNDIQLLIVSWGIVESLRSHECQHANMDDCVDGTTHTKISDLGHE